MSDPLSIILSQQPKFHGQALGPRTRTWGIEPRVLEYIYDTVPDGGTTLETGSGFSTIIFISRSSRHIAIAPDDGERQAIEQFCNENNVERGALEFHAARSEDVLPTLQLPELDGVLIDGSHAFPLPFLDWFYTADALRAGGLLFVDDIQLRTGRILRQFLREEPEWRHVRDLGKTAVFEKLVDGPVTHKRYRRQPWAARKYPLPDASLRNRITFLRRDVRLRTRLREGVRRVRSRRN